MSVVGPVTAIATESKDDPVRAAMEDGAIRGKLLAQARGVIKTNLVEAEDAVQTTLARAWEHRKKYDPAKVPVIVWVRKILTNVCFEMFRKTGQLKDNRSQELQPCQMEPIESMMQLEDVEQVRHLVDRISATNRKAFMLHAIEGRSYEEIAELLGISKVAARKQVSRAWIELRTMIAQTKGAHS